MECLAGKGGGATGTVMVPGEERESQTDTEKCTQREAEIDKHMQKKKCMSQSSSHGVSWQKDVSLGILG